ncbi:APC family permease [bacterium]|nr:APC family permease [bacterium]
MKVALLTLLNLILVSGAIYLFTRRNLLSNFKGGQWWLTWLAVGVITLMDELTSIFYAPSEAHRYIGVAAIVFIPFTALFIHYMTTRMVEIAEILDVHNLKGGGVYNFSYLVLGPVMSFVAVASIMVDYTLTAALSSVSAIENLTPFVELGLSGKLAVEMGVIWLIAGLNIYGIRENTKVTFATFLITAVVFLNLILLGFIHFGSNPVTAFATGVTDTITSFKGHGVFSGYFFFIGAISSCILAYSGIESVLQTASLVENWKVVAKAYMFLALTVGILTPLVSVLVLSAPGINFLEHEGDLIPHFANLLGGKTFSMIFSLVAFATLTMAVNTAFVASSELLERVAHRYGFHWIIKTNERDSLYRIHIASAIFFSIIIYVTQGGQKMLAEMYAVGLVASFVINLASLLIYRYFMGTKEVSAFNVSRSGTLVFFIIIFSCFVYLSYHKPVGFFLWFFVSILFLMVGIYGTRKKSPEFVQIEQGENPMDILFYIAEASDDNVQLYFKRPFDSPQEKLYGTSVFITFYSPRRPIPPRLAPNHFRLPLKGASIYNSIVAILHLVLYELSQKNITVHFGWPTSSWLDRFSIGVMVYQFMKMPKHFPNVNFRIEKYKNI